MLTKGQAKEAGNELLELIDEEGWEIRIWENLGWHYCAKKGHLSVYPTITGKYRASFSTKRGDSATPTYWADRKSYNDPMEAVIAQLRKALEFINSRQAIVYEALESIGRAPEDIFDIPDDDGLRRYPEDR